MVAIQLVCNPYFLPAWFFHQFHAGLFLLSADLPTQLQENNVIVSHSKNKQKTTLYSATSLIRNIWDPLDLRYPQIIVHKVPKGTGIAQGRVATGSNTGPQSTKIAEGLGVCDQLLWQTVCAYPHFATVWPCINFSTDLVDFMSLHNLMIG